MNSFKNNLQYRFKSATIVEQFIYINLAVFVLAYVVKAISFLMNIGGDPIVSWFALPARFDAFLFKPWTLITYGFLHGGFLHILFNLIVLFYFGRLFLDFFSKKQFLIYYFLGIIIGGIVYLLSYNYFPALRDQFPPLVGASAGVTAIIIGLATKIPNYALHFRFIGPVKLWYLAIAFILLDIVQLPLNNTGGHIAHLGGALIGFLLTSQFNDGKALLKIVPKVTFDKKETPLKTVYKKKSVSSKQKPETEQQRKIDEILDKISKSGYETLTKEEKEFLFSVGKK